MLTHSGADSSATGTRRAPVSCPAEHGYDTKYAMHALRIAHQGQELLTTEVRRGELALSDVLTRLHAQSAQLEHAVLGRDLPDEPDHDAVNRFLVNAYQRTWMGGVRIGAADGRRSPSAPDEV
jgi:uncharacterized protein